MADEQHIDHDCKMIEPSILGTDALPDAVVNQELHITVYMTVTGQRLGQLSIGFRFGKYGTPESRGSGPENGYKPTQDEARYMVATMAAAERLMQRVYVDGQG